MTFVILSWCFMNITPQSQYRVWPCSWVYVGVALNPDQAPSSTHEKFDLLWTYELMICQVLFRLGKTLPILLNGNNNNWITRKVMGGGSCYQWELGCRQIVTTPGTITASIILTAKIITMLPRDRKCLHGSSPYMVRFSIRCLGQKR